MARVPAPSERPPVQAGMRFRGVSGADRGLDVDQVVAPLREPLEEAHFVRAWQRVVERHPVLRSRFSWEGVVDPAQEVLDHVQIPALLDGRSWGLLLREIFAFYDGLSRGEDAELPRRCPYVFRK